MGCLVYNHSTGNIALIYVEIFLAKTITAIMWSEINERVMYEKSLNKKSSGNGALWHHDCLHEHTGIGIL